MPQAIFRALGGGKKRASACRDRAQALLFQIYNNSISHTTSVSAFAFNTGFRIDGSPVASPEPAAMLLFCLDLAGLAGVGRFKS